MFVIFDLDGVLVDYAILHQGAFIEAWNYLHKTTQIDSIFHANHLEAQSTRQKLEYLQSFFNIDVKAVEVSILKQYITQQKLQLSSVYKNTIATLHYLKSQNIRMGVCSNSIRSTVETSLLKLAPLNYFDIILSNEDVRNPKPNPEIYNLALERLRIDPCEIIVLEDSDAGKAAARRAGLKTIEIVDALDITPNYLQLILRNAIHLKPLYNIVIPMAGLGSRFSTAGYITPKPFLPVFSTPMYLWVIQNVIPPEIMPYAQIHIIVRAEHTSMFVEAVEKQKNIKVHTVPSLTEGAACTVLSVKEFINNDAPLVIANSDQCLEWDNMDFYRCLTHPDWDGVISTFNQPDSSDIRWSYANINEEGEVTRVEEKKYISPHATTGIYGWKRGSDFVKNAEAMISADIRVNKEFYVCPVYNISIQSGLKIRTLNCKKMWGLGVPADYTYFLENFYTKVGMGIS